MLLILRGLLRSATPLTAVDGSTKTTATFFSVPLDMGGQREGMLRESVARWAIARGSMLTSIAR